MMKEKLKQCFERLQGLEIKPTIGNMEILLQTLYDLRILYQKTEEDEQNADRKTADPE